MTNNILPQHPGMAVVEVCVTGLLLTQLQPGVGRARTLFSSLLSVLLLV